MDTGPTSTTTTHHLMEHYALVPGETAVTFRTRHVFGLLAVTGSLRLVRGSATVDPRDRSLVAVEAVLDARSFASASTARDRVVASPRFLDSTAHPEATYRSSGVERRDGGWLVRGELTVRGVAAPVDLLVAHRAGADGGEHVTATAVVDRTRHGISVPAAMAATELHVSIDARAEHAPHA